jgi:fused signal recognition particle receptor
MNKHATGKHMSETEKREGFFKRLWGQKKDAPQKPVSAEAQEELESITQESPEKDQAELELSTDPAPTRIALVGEENTTLETANAAAPLSWWQRLTRGMNRTSSALSGSVTDIFTKKRLDSAMLDDLEDALIQADLGLETSSRIVKAFGAGRYEKEITADVVRAILAEEVEKALEPVAKPFVVDTSIKPFVVMMVGVNGSGKTTTIGKLAAKAKASGLSVVLAAGDTFRAAAIEQLKVWGARNDVPVIAREQGSDAAGLAFDALREARQNNIDLLMIDTAGRLQNKTGLMAELEKIIRVIKKQDETAPHAVLLVLDATVGQNALSQVELFQKAAPLTGLIMTKLDGTARGGILVALADKFALPIHCIGIGEGIEDLEPFSASDFAKAIAGLDQE